MHLLHPPHGPLPLTGRAQFKLVNSAWHTITVAIAPRAQGMVMDLDQNRFETFDELYLYCYRVAGTVGLMTMPIMGTAPQSSYEEALEPALALGVALQVH